jgi:hypothetical protein
MPTYTTTSVTSFVMGTEDYGNRSMLVMPDGMEYDVDLAPTIQYGSDATKFPESI